MNFIKIIAHEDHYCTNCNKLITEKDIKENNFVYCYNKHHIFMCRNCWEGMFNNGNDRS